MGLTLSLAIRLAEGLGVERSLRAGVALGRAWRALGLPRTRRVDTQLSRAFPEVGPAQLERWAVEVFEGLGRGLAESLLMSGRHRAALLARTRIEGLEHLEAAIRDSGGRGAILIGPHLGNWELAAAKLAEVGPPLAAVHREARQPALEQAVARLRSGPSGGDAAAIASVERIPMGPRAGIRFVRALTTGRTLLVLLDQRARSGEGIDVEFFGQRAQTRVGPIKLAARVGVPILLASTHREPDGRGHCLEIEPPLALESGAERDDEILRRNLQRVTAGLERSIRTHPGQWIWTHRRWRLAELDRDGE